MFGWCFIYHYVTYQPTCSMDFDIGCSNTRIGGALPLVFITHVMSYLCSAFVEMKCERAFVSAHMLFIWFVFCRNLGSTK